MEARQLAKHVLVFALDVPVAPLALVGAKVNAWAVLDAVSIAMAKPIKNVYDITMLGKFSSIVM